MRKALKAAIAYVRTCSACISGRSATPRAMLARRSLCRLARRVLRMAPNHLEYGSQRFFPFLSAGHMR